MHEELHESQPKPKIHSDAYLYEQFKEGDIGIAFDHFLDLRLQINDHMVIGGGMLLLDVFGDVGFIGDGELIALPQTFRRLKTEASTLSDGCFPGGSEWGMIFVEEDLLS